MARERAPPSSAASGVPPSAASGVLGPESELVRSALPVPAGRAAAALPPALPQGPCASWLMRLFRRCSASARDFLTAASALLLCALYASSCSAGHRAGLLAARALRSTARSPRPCAGARPSDPQVHAQGKGMPGMHLPCRRGIGACARGWACM